MIPQDQVVDGDSIALLNDIPDRSITAMITDPPYPNGMNLFTEDLADGLAMLYLATKKVTGHIVFFWRASDVPRPPPGWYEIARHLWHKPDSNSRVPYEAIVVWSRERKNERCRFWSVPLLSLRSLGDWKPHPTQKPVQLLRYLVEAYTKEGDIVFDPFAGSGTTAIACQQMKRHFIAIEKNAEYVAIARERLKLRADREAHRQRWREARDEQQQLQAETNGAQQHPDVETTDEPRGTTTPEPSTANTKQRPKR
jgi:DNA modification methylase